MISDNRLPFLTRSKERKYAPENGSGEHFLPAGGYAARRILSGCAAIQALPDTRMT